MPATISPIFRFTTATILSGETTIVSTTVNGYPLRVLSITPTVEALVTPHTVGINVSTPVFDMPYNKTYDFDINGDILPSKTKRLYYVWKVYLTAGNIDTKFDLMAVL